MLAAANSGTTAGALGCDMSTVDCQYATVAILAATAVATSAILPATLRADAFDASKYELSFDIKFSGYTGTGTLTDFPVLIRLSKALNDFRYASCKALNGGDLRFADANGNLLPSEVERWDATGESLVWVKVPTLTKDTVITAHYGCATPDAVTPTQVWDSHFLAVWHLGAEQGTTTQSDSTANGKDFGIETAYADGVAVGTAGVAGLAAAFHQREDGKGCYSQSDSSGYFAGFTAFTMEAWTYQDNHEVGTLATDYCVLKKGPSNPTWQIYETKNDGRIGYSFKTNNTSSAAYITPAKDNANKPVRATWNHSVFTFDSASGARGVYLNGTSRQNYAILPANVVTVSDNASSLYLGGQLLNNSASFPGTIDEVRISDIARSADWVKATYDTINTPGFASYEAGNDWARYRKRFSIAFDGIQEGVTLTDFPVLVRLSENNPVGFHYADCLKPNGGDLRFRVSGTDAVLPCEIEKWNTGGESLVWVKVPTLTRGTHLFAYYGWNLAPSVNPTQVWDEHFLGVWHLDAAAGMTTQSDSTQHSATFSVYPDYPNDVVAGANGICGLAVATGQDNKKGGYNYSDTAKRFSGMSQITVEVWNYWDHDVPLSANREIMAHGNNVGSVDWTLDEHKAGKLQLSYKRVSASTGKTNELYASSSSTDAPLLARNAWNYSAAVVNNETGWRGAYMNGALLTDYALDSSRIGQMMNRYSILHLGNSRHDQAYAFVGLLDEVRISDTVRSAAWLKATHDTIRPNSGFATYSEADKNAQAFIMIIR